MYRQSGKVYNRNFAILFSFVDENGELKLHQFADSGIVNDCVEISRLDSLPKKMIKRCLHRVFVDSLVKYQTFELYWEWFYVGQKTQYNTLNSVYGITADEFIQQYVHPIVLFVLDWTNIDQEDRSNVIEIVEDVILMDEVEMNKKWSHTLHALGQKHNFKQFLNFFYYHGN